MGVSIMNSSDLKRKMSELWKDSFHYSDAYISLLFNNCFNPQLCEYEEQDGAVVAAIFGIPYKFGNSERSIRALFLCGVTTKSQFRSQGIMTKLLDRINNKAANAGFAFTFLLPPDKGLRKYFFDRNYVNAFYRVVDNYTSLHDFDRDYESILLEQKEKVAELKRKHYSLLKVAKVDKDNPASEEMASGIHSLIHDCESAQADLQILHTDDDINTIIRQYSITPTGAVYVCTTPSGKVSAVAFTKCDDTTVIVDKMFSADLASRYKVLNAIKIDQPTRGIRHYVSSIEMDRKALWLRTYGSAMPEAAQVGTVSVAERVYSLAAHAKIYGMAKILNLAEILKFQAENRRELKYSILVKLDDPYTMELLECKNGVVSIKRLASDDLSPSQKASAMSKRAIGEILFRRRDTDNMITEAFGIPSINAAASLLFD